MRTEPALYTYCETCRFTVDPGTRCPLHPAAPHATALVDDPAGPDAPETEVRP